MHTNPRASGNFGHAAGSLKTPALPHFTELPLSRCDHACELPDILILTLSQPSVEIIRSTPKGVIWILSSVHVLVGTIVAWIHPFPAQPAKELTTDHDHHDEARTSKTRPGSPMQHRSNTCTALRVRRSPASATRSQQPSCDGCGGASGGAAPAEHKAVAARASTATPGCYNPGGCGWGETRPPGAMGAQPAADKSKYEVPACGEAGRRRGKVARAPPAAA